MVGQPLQHIAYIDRQAPWRRGDVHPAAIGAQNLQTCLLCPQQQGDEVNVLMRACPDAAFGIASYGGIMQ